MPLKENNLFGEKFLFFSEGEGKVDKTEKHPTKQEKKLNQLVFEQ